MTLGGFPSGIGVKRMGRIDINKRFQPGGERYSEKEIVEINRTNQTIYPLKCDFVETSVKIMLGNEVVSVHASSQQYDGFIVSGPRTSTGAFGLRSVKGAWSVQYELSSIGDLGLFLYMEHHNFGI